MADLSVPNTLVNGETILAAPLNQNFDALKNYINDRNSGDEFWDNMKAVDVAATTLVATASVSTVDLAATGTATVGTAVVTGLTKTTGGVHVGGTSDPGADNLLVDGTAEITGTTTLTGLTKTVGGLHVGGTSDPGADNLVVDGTANVVGALSENSSRVFSNASMFESAEQAFSNGFTAIDVAHGLAGVPRMVYAVLRCKTADADYAPGDEMIIYSYDAPAIGNFSVGANATYCWARFNIGSIRIPNKSTGNQVNLVYADWKLVFRAWY